MSIQGLGFPKGVIRSGFPSRVFSRGMFTCLALIGLMLARPSLANGVPFSSGDIVVSVTDGYGYSWDSKILHYDSNGVLLDTIDLGVSDASYVGMRFDSQGNLYLAKITSYDQNDDVIKINSDGTVAGSFGSGYYAPWSISFDSDDNAYIGEDPANVTGAGTLAPILEVDPFGDPKASMLAQTDRGGYGGVEYADLASDQCTLRYTGQNYRIMQFDVCTGTQLPDLDSFIPEPGSTSTSPSNELLYVVRQMSNGNILVGTLDDALMLGANGAVLRRFHVDGSALNDVSPATATTFVAADVGNNTIYRFDINTGAVVAHFKIPSSLAYTINSMTAVPGGSFKPNEDLGAERHCKKKNCSDHAQVGDPINTATGNEYRDDVDASLRGLSFERYYNSDGSVVSTHIGQHWRDNYDRSISYPAGTAPTSVVMFRQDGKQLPFHLNAGQWVSDPDIADSLTEQVDTNGAPSGWDYFVASTRETEHYNAKGQLQTITNFAGQVTQLDYSTTSTPTTVAPQAGLLIGVTSPAGRVLSIAYNADANIISVKEPDGSSLGYGYDAAGNLSTVSYPDQSSRQFLYDESAQTGGADLPHALTGVIDESGTRYATITYNAQGKATSSHLAGGADQTQVVYNTDGSTSITYPNQVTVDMGYAKPHNIHYPSSVSNPCGPDCDQPNQVQTFDANGYMASRTDFNGNVTLTTHDDNGLLDVLTEGSGTSSQRTTTINWNTTLRVPLSLTVVDPSGSVVGETEWVYNTHGQVLAKCEIDPGNPNAVNYTCRQTGTTPDGVRRWTYTYCDAVDSIQCPLVGLLLTVTGPRTDLGEITSFSYYMDSATSGCGIAGGACHQPGDLQSFTDPLGHVTHIDAYDADGRIAQVTDPNGVVTALTYTARGWLASRSVGGAVMQFTYTPFGEVATVTDADGVVLNFGYDGAHRLTSIHDALGNSIQFNLDVAGNRTQEQVLDRNGNIRQSSSSTYNALGELTSVVDGLDQTVFSAGFNDSYDANGNLVHSANALGTQQVRSYDPLNRLVNVIRDAGGVDSSTANTQTTMAYDPMGRLAGVTDPDNLSTVYTFNGLSDRVSVDSPDTGASTDTHDAAGNVITHTDAEGLTSTSSYDALNRVTSIQYADSSLDVTYMYDQPGSETGCHQADYSIGHLTTMVDASGKATYCYDALGRVRVKKVRRGGHRYVTRYRYTPAGRIREIVYPSGVAVRYHYRRNGTLSKVAARHVGASQFSVIADRIRYLPFGPIHRYTLGNGQIVRRRYDANYRLTDLVSPLFKLHYTRNALGDITATGKRKGANPASESYSYDALRRLTTITEADGSTLQSYAYSPAGDRLSKIGAGLSTGGYTYANGTHHLLSVGVEPYNVDADGQTTSFQRAGQNYVFTYDARHRMATAQVGTGSVVSYVYNALGERTSKVVGAVNPVRFFYDESNHLLTRDESAGTRDYIWVGDMPVALIDTPTGESGGTDYYIIAGALGAPRLVTDAAGADVWRWSQKGNLFGEGAPVSVTGFELDLRMPGQYFDTETGLDFNLNRYYDPSVARYTRSDPAGLAGGINTYAYALNNPLYYFDKSGKDPVSALVGGFLGGTWGLVNGLIAGHSGTELLNDVADNAAEGALIGLTDGLSLVPGLVAEIGISAGIDLLHQTETGMLHGCIKINGKKLAEAVVGTLIGDNVGDWAGKAGLNTDNAAAAGSITEGLLGSAGAVGERGR